MIAGATREEREAEVAKLAKEAGETSAKVPWPQPSPQPCFLMFSALTQALACYVYSRSTERSYVHTPAFLY